MRLNNEIECNRKNVHFLMKHIENVEFVNYHQCVQY